MKRKVKREPRRIAVFGGRDKKLVAVIGSMTQAAHVLGVKTAAISYASRGLTVACQGWYLRELTNVVLEWDDIGNLTLEDFDRLNGEQRPVYPDRGMRKRRKQTTSTV